MAKYAEGFKPEPGLYALLNEQHFGPASAISKLGLSREMQATRRDDIIDTCTRTRQVVAAHFPDADAELVDRVTTLVAFYERAGFESGIDFNANPENYGVRSQPAGLAASLNDPRNVARKMTNGGW